MYYFAALVLSNALPEIGDKMAHALALYIINGTEIV